MRAQPNRYPPAPNSLLSPPVGVVGGERVRRDREGRKGKEEKEEEKGGTSNNSPRRAKFSQRNMMIFTKIDISIDFIRNRNNIIFFTDFCDFFKFLGRVNGSGRVVGRVKNKDFL